MISFEEVGIILDEISTELPDDFYRELNGGINLLPDIKFHAESNGDDNLVILGEYHNERGLGRYIDIYYGSFIKVYAYHPLSMQREELKRILLHEFTHHIESLAGENALEIKDAKNLASYKKNKQS